MFLQAGPPLLLIFLAVAVFFGLFVLLPVSLVATAFGKLVFIVPVYLWKRAKALQQRPAYFWVWMILFVLTLLG